MLLIGMDGFGGEDGLGGKCIVAGAVCVAPVDDDALAGTVCARLARGAETGREFIAGAASPIDDDALAGAVVFRRGDDRYYPARFPCRAVSGRHESRRAPVAPLSGNLSIAEARLQTVPKERLHVA